MVFCMLPPFRLPRRLQASLESSALELLQPRASRFIDFSRPAGEAALAAPLSQSWRICKNPIALLTGGMTAVILELAEPAVRTGVWEHSTFLKNPLGRLQRTGMAAMVTVYGATSVSLPMIARVVKMHSLVTGSTPAGEPFFANDPRLLRWVQATASFGFAQAYSGYVAELGRVEVDRLYMESGPSARLYGAIDAPDSSAAMTALFDSMRERLEPSDIVREFLRIMRSTCALPAALRWLQPLLVSAAVDLLPDWVRGRLRLSAREGLSRHERALVKAAGVFADRLMLTAMPPWQACLRVGFDPRHLYSSPPRNAGPIISPAPRGS